MRTGGLFDGPCRWTLQILCLLLMVNGQCTKFEFPATDVTFKATKNTTVTLPFLLRTESCNKDDLEYTISISKKDNGIFSDFCKLFLCSNGSCVSFREENCKCEEEKGSYSLTKTIDMSDQTMWRWRTSDGTIASDKTIQFIVNYPTRVTRLSLQSVAYHAPLTRAVKPGTSVEILCNFEEGKPASPPFLQNSQGELLDAEHGEGQGEIKHVLPDVTCDDAGTISCEAPGAMENKSAELLVECPPEFTEKTFENHVVSAEQPVELMFQMRTHSREIASCYVTKYPGSKPDAEDKLPVDDYNLTEECLSDVTLFGSPPDLTLKMTLRELTSQDVGKWHLTIANEFGSDNISFALEINGLPDENASGYMQSTTSTPNPYSAVEELSQPTRPPRLIVDENASSYMQPTTSTPNPYSTVEERSQPTRPPRLIVGPSDSVGGSHTPLITTRLTTGQGSVSSTAISVVIALAVLVIVVTIVITLVKCRRRRLSRHQYPNLSPNVHPTLASYVEFPCARQLSEPSIDEDASGYMQPINSTPNPHSALEEPSQPTRPPRLIVGESELQPAAISAPYVQI